MTDTILKKYIKAIEQENIVLILKGRDTCQTEFYAHEPTDRFPRPWRVIRYGAEPSGAGLSESYSDDKQELALICAERGGHYDDIVAKNVPVKIARAIVHEINFLEALDPSEF